LKKAKQATKELDEDDVAFQKKQKEEQAKVNAAKQNVAQGKKVTGKK
jgi:hypothetical protein